MLEGIDFLFMVLKMNVLNGIFYKREMSQPKYHWVEKKYLGAISKPTSPPFFPKWQCFFSIYVLICLGNCRYLINIYSNMFVNIRNIQILILSRKMYSLEISCLPKIKIEIQNKTGTVVYKIKGSLYANKLRSLEHKIEKLNFSRRLTWCPIPVREWLIFSISQTNIKHI